MRARLGQACVDAVVLNSPVDEHGLVISGRPDYHLPFDAVIAVHDWRLIRDFSDG